jgi:hypothetical protein
VFEKFDLERVWHVGVQQLLSAGNKPMKALTRRNFLQTAALATTATALAEAGGSHTEIYSEVYPLDGADWLLDVDPSNTGYSQGWAKSPTAQAKATKVPWVIQGSFPDYHGFAWYWKEFDAPRNPHREGQYLIRFHGVDYLGEVFVNGTRIGLHEGGEEPFTVNVTGALRPGQRNLLAVRVLNPTHELLDGIRLQEVAEGRRDYPHPRDNAYNTGGITNSVELLVTPPVHIEEVHTVPDWKTGEVRVVATIRNETSRVIPAHLIFAACPARASNSLSSTSLDRALKPGENQLNASLNIAHHRLWELNDPFLYHLTARVQAAGAESVDAYSVRFGFRDFRFAEGYFRLNGRRIYIHGALYTVLQYPISQTTPFDEDLLRRDVLNMKSLGFNSIRITCGAALPRQLDLMDEMGLLACEEHFGARAPANSQYLEKRWDRSIVAVVRRDRNHPCIVMWSLLNEVGDGPLFRHVVQSLPAIRQLDQSRLIVLGSGRFDNDSKIGSLSNPGSVEWESNLVDLHAYPSFPHSARTIEQMRSATSNFSAYGTATSGKNIPASSLPPVLLSEYGVCGAQDYPRFLRNFEQLNAEHAADAALFHEKWELFFSDWKKYRLDECWAQPEDYFRESQRTQAKLAAGDYNAWNANPALVGDFNSTQITDAWFHGCGITNYFRELKPGMADVFSDMGAPIRWCLFADGANLYRGAKVHLDAVLVNRDVLKAGEYPMRFQLVGPGVARVLDTTIMVKVAGVGQSDAPFAQPVFSKDLVVDGPPGIYRFSATFQKGAAAAGFPAEFYLADPASLPPVQSEITLWGKDDALARWLNSRGVRVRNSLGSEQTAREVILACGTVDASEKPALFSELARRVARGSSVIFLAPGPLLDVSFDGKHPQPLRWLPIDSDTPPLLAHTPDWYFHADPWAKEHPVFSGLPSGGILDYTFYRDIISSTVFRNLSSPLEAICGTIQTSGGSDDYCSDLLIAEYPFGAGRILLNNLRIIENIGRVPAADRLLLNMLNYSARDLDKPVSDVPASLNDRLRAIGSASPQK